MAVDMELRKAFSELQKKMVETQTQVKICDAQINALALEGKKTILTTKEIQSLPTDVKLYESVGRMFILQPRSNVIDNLNGKRKDAEAKTKELEAKKTYLIRNVKSSEENLREMVSQRRK
ncbi:prefoldin subunit 1-like [Clavelina lepadiformis]|uniref:Prefoldin subunit 1 n=1 Tax=Clavelina lepadiformis TaxID=159417 RepID=A0ABP0F8R1_CLALP